MLRPCLSVWESHLVAYTMAAVTVQCVTMCTGMSYTMNSNSTDTLLLVGMDAEGLYRISGKTNDILRIKKEFDNSELVN